MDGLLTLARERKINGHGDSTTKAKNGQKKKKIMLSVVKKVKEYRLLFERQSGVVAIQISTEWTGLRNRLNKGIHHAPICKLLNIIYLLHGNLVWSLCTIILPFIPLVSLKTGIMRIIFLSLTGPYSPDLYPLKHDCVKFEERIYICFIQILNSLTTLKIN